MSSLRKLIKETGKRSLRVLSDEAFLKTYYQLSLAKRLNLRHPRRFTEKLQWMKLHDRNPLYSRLADKYEVKNWVAQRIGEEFIVPTYGVWDSFEDVDFEALPSQFVLKCTHDSGGLSICREKNTFDVERARKKITASLKSSYFEISREWPYKNIRPRVLAEKYLEQDATGFHSDHTKGIVDYKFFCFHGNPKYLSVSQGSDNPETAQRVLLNLDWTPAAFEDRYCTGFQTAPRQPISYSQMLSSAAALSQGLPFVRVDMYEIAAKPLFSEMTFYPTGGFIALRPDEWDTEIGSWLDLNEITKQPAE